MSPSVTLTLIYIYIFMYIYVNMCVCARASDWYSLCRIQGTTVKEADPLRYGPGISFLGKLRYSHKVEKRKKWHNNILLHEVYVSLMCNQHILFFHKCIIDIPIITVLNKIMKQHLNVEVIYINRIEVGGLKGLRCIENPGPRLGSMTMSTCRLLLGIIKAFYISSQHYYPQILSKL